ncbi:MAG: hypothetical protein IKR76_04670 [Ruminococcus sp.]|nr:hypothetical protein [Ruminococcus sp.]
MKRRIIISICAAVFMFGIIGILNRTPTVTIGVVTLSEGADERELKGYEISTLRNGETTRTEEEPDIKDLAASLTSVEQEVMKNDSDTAVRVNTNMSVAFAGGKYVDDVTYTVFSTSGEMISNPAAQLSLPTKDIDSCVVRIDVKWGRTKNYKEYYYFFRIDYDKQA